VEVQQEARGDLVVEADEGFTVALDPAITEELRQEGLARELVNRIQRIRREAGLRVEDRIRLGIAGEDEVVSAARAFGEYIAGETLAREYAVGKELGAEYAVERDVELDELRARIGLEAV
jgi:isoleucyl-tRNA synthetase